MPKALLSVHDKTGLIDFARGLTALGWTVLASGGTARLLREQQLPVTEVADYTRSPEILGGRGRHRHPAPNARAHGQDWSGREVRGDFRGNARGNARREVQRRG